MKTIKDVKEIYLERGLYWFWGLSNPQEYGLGERVVSKEYKTKQAAINNFKKFAEINEIKDYKIIG